MSEAGFVGLEGLTGFFERTKKSYNPKIKEILMLTKCLKQDL
jgi:hypothetical protein